VGSGALSQGYSRQGMKLTTHLYLVLRLRMSGAVPLFPLYVLMVQAGTTVPFILLNKRYAISEAGCVSIFTFKKEACLIKPVLITGSSSSLAALIFV
jgi:hypothetical protein